MTDSPTKELPLFPLESMLQAGLKELEENGVFDETSIDEDEWSDLLTFIWQAMYTAHTGHAET